MFARFLKDRRGGVAPMLAIAAVPLFGMVGAAIDYSRANAARASLQAAVDSTALIVSKSAATQSSGDLQTAASNAFAALYTRPEASNAAVTASYSSTDGSKVTLTGSAVVKTMILNALGIDQIAISATATSGWSM